MIIAPCGINCTLCYAFQRKKDKCVGCTINGNKHNHCINCIIKNCDEKKENELCIYCQIYPCKKMKDLIKRYRTRYGVDLNENMEIIKEKGIEVFEQLENEKWECKKCGSILCMHHEICKNCNEINKYYIGTKKK